MQTNNNLQREQLQEMLADYALGNLSELEAADVRTSLQNHPDLLEEVKNITNVFSRFDKQKVTSTIDYQTRNLSVLVNQRMRNQKRSVSQLLFGRMLPVAVGLTALLVLIRFTTTTNQIVTIDEDISQAIMLDSSLIQTVQNGISEPTLGSPNPEATSMISDTTNLSDNLDELLAESIISSTTEQADPDLMETEKLQLQNKVDIDDIEKMLQELSDDAG